MFGDGSMARDYTFIDDIVNGVFCALARPFPFEVFNLGNESSITLLRLVSELELASGQKVRIEQLPLQRGDVERTCADVSKARAMLGYNPSIDIRDGLEEFVHWFDEQTGRVSNRESVRRSSGI
jgi:UDP-glucuronate 4-epimerase